MSALLKVDAELLGFANLELNFKDELIKINQELGALAKKEATLITSSET